MQENNPYIILENYYELSPDNNMSRIKQLNIITRILIFLFIIFIIFNINGSIALLFLLGIIV